MYRCPHIPELIRHSRERIPGIIGNIDKHFIHNLFLRVLEHIVIRGNNRDPLIPFSYLIVIDYRDTRQTVRPVPGIIRLRHNPRHAVRRCHEKHLICRPLIPVDLQQVVF